MEMTYNLLIRGFITNSKMKALQLIDEMKKRGFSADASTAKLFDDLISRGKLDPSLRPIQEVISKVF